MGIYVTKASALKELLEQHMPDANDFGNEVIPGARKMGYPVQVRPSVSWQCSAVQSIIGQTIQQLTNQHT